MTDSSNAQARATFRHMTDGTQDDWSVISQSAIAHCRSLPDRVMAHLRLLQGDFGGFPVDRLEHSLQTATRAQRDGRDDEYVICALLHDIGDTLGSFNHADIGAAILKPFVTPQNHWMLENHAIFQGYYYFHHLGLDRDMRERFRSHEWFDYTAEFCELYDQCAFETDYKSEPLEHFAPMLRAFMAYPRRSIYVRSE